MDVAALVISILALVFSGIVLIVETIREFKITRMGMEFEFYMEIYKEHLIKKIPEARRVMRFDESHCLKDAQPLIDELNEIRRDSLYFMYNNKNFYTQLKTKLQTLEDYLIVTEAKKVLADEQTAFWNEVQEGLKGIYETISKAYRGKIK